MKSTLNCSMPASRSRSSLAVGDLLVALEDDLAGLLVDDVVRGDLADQLLDLDRQALDLGFLQLLDRGLGELGVLLDDDLAADLDVARRALAGEEVVLDRSSRTCRPSRGTPSRSSRSS